MKKYFTFVILLLFLFTLTPTSVWALDESTDLSISAGSHSMDGQIPVLGTDARIQNIKSAILYEVNSDTLMYAWNADEQMAPASLTKILTALIAIEKGDLSADVTVKEAVLSSVGKGAVTSELLAGEVMKLEDLLYCMLVDSGNDAAAVIADFISGSQAAFVQEMNDYAQKIGCKNTNFINAHGLHEEAQYTTARDMGRILAAASKNETFCQIFGAVFHTVPTNNLVSEERHLATDNALLNPDKGRAFYDEDVLGSRTGLDRNGFRCVASIAEKNGLRFVVIVMGAESEQKEYSGYLETTELINLGASGFKRYHLLYAGQVMKQAEVINGDCAVSLATQKSLSTILPGEISMDDISVHYENVQPDITAPIAKGQKISRVKYMYGGTCVAQADLYALNSVSDKENSVKIEQPQFKKISPWKTILKVFVIVICVVFILIISLRIYIVISMKVKDKQTSRRRADRRRSK